MNSPKKSPLSRRHTWATLVTVGIILNSFIAAGVVLATGKGPVGEVGARSTQREPVTMPDGPCVDEIDRYVDCMNGTVTDTATGLIWLQQADCLTGATPAEATAAAAALGDGQCNLTDLSSPGDWRLPTKAEWAATIDPTSALGCRFSLVGGLPSLTNETSQGCFQELEQEGSGDSAVYPGVLSFVYLSGTADGDDFTVASLSFLGDGDFNFIGSFGQGLSLRVWPVRSPTG